LAGLVVFLALVAPDKASRLTPGAFLRIPMEALAFVAVALLLPRRPRGMLAVVAGVVLGLLTILKILDIGFYGVLDRPFDPVLDWTLLGDAVDFLQRSTGRIAAAGAVVAAVVIAAAVPVILALSALRLTHLVARHRDRAVRSAGVLMVGWILCAAL